MTERNETAVNDAPPMQMETFYMGFLRRGPEWSAAEETEETVALQEAHQAHIRQMHASGALLIAGPFLDGGDLRGVFLFATETQDDAEALAAADPAVQAGRLIIDVHPWMVPAGILGRGHAAG